MISFNAHEQKFLIIVWFLEKFRKTLSNSCRLRLGCLPWNNEFFSKDNRLFEKYFQKIDIKERPISTKNSNCFIPTSHQKSVLM